MKNGIFANYSDDADYNTNANSYYDDLARKQHLIKLLSEKIWQYENTLNETLQDIESRVQQRFAEWDGRIESFPDNVESLLQDWLSDGTLDHIINETIFNFKADKADLDETNKRLMKTYKVTRLDDYEHLVLNKEDSKSNWDWSDALQQAIIDSTGVLQIPFKQVTINKTIYLRNDLTIIGNGHANATHLYAGDGFYSNPDNYFVDGLPVLLKGSTNGTDKGDDVRCSHFKMGNIHLLSQKWSKFTTGQEVFSGRRNAIAIHGIFFEGNFEDVSASGFEIAFDIECNNTKFIGSAIALGNGITYNLSGHGGSIIQTSSVMGNNSVRLKEKTTAFNIYSLHTESTTIPFVIEKECHNITIISPHLYNIKGQPARIHPSSSVTFMGDPMTIESNGRVSDSIVTKTRSIPSFDETLKPVELVSDGNLQSGDMRYWEVLNGTAKKVKYSRDVFSRGIHEDNGKKVMEIKPNASFMLSNTIQKLGLLDLEFTAEETQAIRLRVKDSTGAIIYDSGYIKGGLTSHSKKHMPSKINGFISGGTPPYTMELTTETTAAFILNKLQVYEGNKWEQTSGNTVFENTGEKINGFDVYKLSGNPSSASVQSVPNGFTNGHNNYKIMGYVKSDTNNIFETKETLKTRSQDRINLIANDTYQYFESSIESKTHLQLIKRSSGDIFMYGLGILKLYSTKDGHIVGDKKPPFGFWNVGSKIANNVLENGFEGWINTNPGKDGLSGDWKKYGILNNTEVSEKVSLSNGWTGDLYYSKNALDQVWLRGFVIAGTVSSGTVIGTLPDGFESSIVSTQISVKQNVSPYASINGLQLVTSGDLVIRDPLSTQITKGQRLEINYLYQR